MKKLLTLGCFLYLSSGLWAQPYQTGTVYGVYPEGVLVQRGGAAYLVPQQQATFQLGGLRVSWSDLQPGQSINYYVPQQSRIRYVQDPYQWERRNHPRHPHGMPPGQRKKMNSGRW